ncbi:MAG: hypothetical protein ACRET7_12345 [Burkholderiales bacterium]
MATVAVTRRAPAGKASCGLAYKHDTESRNDGVKALILEGKSLSVANLKIDRQPHLSGTSLCVLNEIGTEVNADDTGPGMICEFMSFS